MHVIELFIGTECPNANTTPFEKISIFIANRVRTTYGIETTKKAAVINNKNNRMIRRCLGHTELTKEIYNFSVFSTIAITPTANTYNWRKSF